MSTFPTRSLGSSGLDVSCLGLGLMGMSAWYGPIMEDNDAFVLLDRAIELGCTFWDTSDIYGGNEDLLGRYFHSRPGARDKVTLATKFGIYADGDSLGVRNGADYAIECCERSLKRLGVSVIDLYYIHRIDPSVPIEETMHGLAKLKKEGKIRAIGLSEASANTLRRAHAIVPVDAHQVEYSPFELSIEHDEIGVLKTCRELGITTVAYSPLSRGLLSGKLRSRLDFDSTDGRLDMPRFSEENFATNIAIVDKFAGLAAKHGATSGQLALAWLLTQSDVIPIPGTTKLKNLEENLGAIAVALGDSELAELSTLIKAADVHGARYEEDDPLPVQQDTAPL